MTKGEREDTMRDENLRLKRQRQEIKRLNSERHEAEYQAPRNLSHTEQTHEGTTRMTPCNPEAHTVVFERNAGPTSSALINLPGHLLAEVASYLPAADAAKLSRTSPYVCTQPMRAPIEAARVDFLSRYRVPQARARLTQRFCGHGSPLPKWITQNPLKAEHFAELTFDVNKPNLVSLLSGHSTAPVSSHPSRQGEPPNCVNTAVFTQGGGIFSGGHDADVRYWQKDANNVWRSQVLSGHTRPVDTLATDATGSRVLSAGWGTDIILHRQITEGGWTAETLDQTQDMRDRYYTRPSAWFSPAGRFAITAPTTPMPQHIHALQRATPFALGQDSDYQQTLFNQADTHAFLVPRLPTREGHIHCWQQGAQGGWTHSRLIGHTRPPHTLSLSPDEAYLLSTASDETIVWQRGQQNAWAPHLRIAGAVYDTQFSPNSQSLAARTDLNGNISVWRLDAPSDTVDNPTRLAGFTHLSYGMGFSPDGQSFYVSGSDRHADPSTPYAVKVFSQNDSGEWVLSNTLGFDSVYGPTLVISPDLKHVLVKGAELTENDAGTRIVGRPRFWLYDAGPDQMRGTGTLLRGKDWIAEQAAFSADGSQLLVIDDHHQLRVIKKAQ